MRQIGNDIRMHVNDIIVSFSDQGPEQGTAVVFIHGFPFNKSMWDIQVAALKDNFRVITYDVRGHGNSEAGHVEVSVVLFANDLICLMDALKIEKAILCGLSMGGYIALNAVEKYPSRFMGMILSDTNCKADTTMGKEKRKRTIETIHEYGVEKYADESIKNLFAPESFIKKQEAIAHARMMITQTAGHSLCNTLIALSGRKETCSKLSEIKIPVLIMVGKEDTITPPEAAQFMHQKIKGSVLRIVDHAGHLSNMENPEEFNEQLERFIMAIKSD